MEDSEKLEITVRDLKSIIGLMGNVDHSKGGGENAARLYGGMLMGIKDYSQKTLGKIGEVVPVD